MHPIGTKVKHVFTGDYGFIVGVPERFNTLNVFKDNWVLWLSPGEFFGKVLWEDPRVLYPVELDG